jgi:hypothetical protein
MGLMGQSRLVTLKDKGILQYLVNVGGDFATFARMTIVQTIKYLLVSYGSNNIVTSV